MVTRVSGHLYGLSTECPPRKDANVLFLEHYSKGIHTVIRMHAGAEATLSGTLRHDSAASFGQKKKPFHSIKKELLMKY